MNSFRFRSSTISASSSLLATPARELAAFALVLALTLGGLLGESLWGGKVLSPADVMLTTESFRELLPADVADYEPRNRLLMDPVLQFQPWLEFNRSMIRQGRLPLWNDKAGCGAPHLANGQSAPFDPFHLIAYLGTLPDAWAAIAWARLWVAGLGMFLLARLWGMRRGGRWLAGLTFPLSGFMVGWLLYPVASAAVWLPWMIWAAERLLKRPGPRSAGVLALTIGAALLGGHIQTSAHGLLALAAYWGWRWIGGERSVRQAAWSGLGLTLGLMIGAVSYLPLAFYLRESPVWSDRLAEHPPFWRWERPRVLDMACAALPFAFGSQQAGHPNLARGLGVGNINEAAGGYAGLLAIVALAPLSWFGRKRHQTVIFLGFMAVFGGCASFGLPPVSNLLRAIPALQVMDHRRLALWLAFGLSGLAGFGFDRLAMLRLRRVGSPIRIAAVLGAVALLGAAALAASARPWIEPRIVRHYEEAAKTDFGAREDAYRVRAQRQTEAVVRVLPLYYGRSALILIVLAVVAGPRPRLSLRNRRAAVFAVHLADLVATAWGRNPAIDPRWDRPVPAVVDRLREGVGDRGRVLGLGAEWLPNSLSRYGLADPRNYDSIELSRALDRLEPMYEPDPRMRSSRRDVNWGGVERGWDRLREASVMAIVAPAPPPPAIAARARGRVERVGDVWVVWLPDVSPLIELTPENAGAGSPRVIHQGPGWLELETNLTSSAELIVRQTWDSGWRSWIDGRETPMGPSASSFFRLGLPAGQRRIILAYRPFPVLAALMISAAGLVGAFALGCLSLRKGRAARTVSRPPQKLARESRKIPEGWL